MRAVLLGTDLMYDKSGRLVPIEINTNVGYDLTNRIETVDEWLDLKSLVEFVKNQNLKRVAIDKSTGLPNYFPEFSKRVKAALGGIADVILSDSEEDENDDTLYIRVAYSEEALIDSLCRDKVAFLDAISNSSEIAQEYLYKENGEVRGNMKDFLDNGEDPNYVIKFRYPYYSSEYPMYYRLDSLEAVRELANNLEDDYIIMPCYLNENNLQDGRVVVIRQWSIITPDKKSTLKVVNLGSYTKLSGKIDRSLNKFEETTGKLLKGRNNYNSKYWMKDVADVLLDEGDEVLMADGTWKPIEEVKVGDKALSVDVPHAAEVNIRKHTGKYSVSVEEFESDSKYSEVTVEYKQDVEGFQDLVHITFEEDDEDWYDTVGSSYPVIDREDGTVRFEEIGNLKEGDVILLLAYSNIDESDTVEYVERTIEAISTERKLTTGYTIGVTGSHLFITRAPGSKVGYVSIEHNSDWECGSCDNACSDEGYNYDEGGFLNSTEAWEVVYGLRADGHDADVAQYQYTGAKGAWCYCACYN